MVAHTPLFGTTQVKIEFLERDLHPLDKLPLRHTDTTHYYAYSGYETVKYKGKDGKEQKKSQSKLTKECRCPDRTKCEHDWVLADEGAGTVVKSKTKMYWAHKASVLGFPRQGIALDARAVLDGSTHDGETYLPHVEQVLIRIR